MEEAVESNKFGLSTINQLTVLYFFVDLSCLIKEYIEESKSLFRRIINDPVLEGIPFLIVGNKADIAWLSIADVKANL